MTDSASPHLRPLVSAGVMLGIGMGGFLDGILFHQLLQTHSMLSATVPKTSIANVEVNMFWDGLFHAFTWLTTALGIAALWSATRQNVIPGSSRVLIGSMVLGWGLFNFVEGIIDHYWLHLHHVVERLGLSVYDHAFIASGVLLSGLGLLLIRAGKKREVARYPHFRAARQPG
jgi:uncharacterized membrane protein